MSGPNRDSRRAQVIEFDPVVAGPAELYDLSEDELWLHGALSSMAAKEIAATCKTTKILGVRLGAEGLNFNVDENGGHRLGIRHSGYALLCSQVYTFMNDLRDVYGTREMMAQEPV